MYLSTSNLSHAVAVAPDRKRAQYAGAAAHSLDVGVVRAAESWPTPRPLLAEDIRHIPLGVDYFEVNIQNGGQNCSVTVGLVRKNSHMCIQPGLSKGTFGYRADSGNRFRGPPIHRRPHPLRQSSEEHGHDDGIVDDESEDNDSDEDLWGPGNRRNNQSSGGEAYGETFGEGDVIGCGYVLRTREVFFTKNGKHLGIAFRNVTGTLYPAVGMHSPGEAVEVNFTGPFRFSLDNFHKETVDKLTEEQARINVKPSVVASIVQDYLLHNGYAHALFWLQESLRGNKSSIMESTDNKRAHQEDEDCKSKQTPVKYDAASGGYGKVRKGHSDNEEPVTSNVDWWSPDALTNLESQVNCSVTSKVLKPNRSSGRAPRPPPLTPHDNRDASGIGASSGSSLENNTWKKSKVNSASFLGMRKRGSGNPFCCVSEQQPYGQEMHASFISSHQGNDKLGIHKRFGTPPGIENVNTPASKDRGNGKKTPSALADLQKAQSQATLSTNYRTPLFGPMASPASTARQYAEKSAEVSEAAERIAQQRDALLSRLRKGDATEENDSDDDCHSSSSSDGVMEETGPVRRPRSQRSIETPQSEGAPGRARSWSLNLPTSSPNSFQSSSAASHGSGISPFSSAFHRVFENIRNENHKPKSISRGSIPFIPASPMLTATADNVADDPSGSLFSQSNDALDHFKRQWSEMGNSHIPLAMAAPKRKEDLDTKLDIDHDSCAEESESSLIAGSFAVFKNRSDSEATQENGCEARDEANGNNDGNESSSSSSESHDEQDETFIRALRNQGRRQHNEQKRKPTTEKLKIFWSDRLLSYADVTTVKQITLPLRYECRALIMKGEIAETMSLLESYAPFLLNCQRYRVRVTCRLLSHWCIELYREGKTEQAWDVFVNEALPLLNEPDAPFTGSIDQVGPSFLNILRSTALMLNSGVNSILDNSVSEFLLSDRGRDTVADEVNNALLDYGLLLRGKQRIATYLARQKRKDTETRTNDNDNQQGNEEEEARESRNGQVASARQRRRRSQSAQRAERGERSDSFSQVFHSLSHFPLFQRLFRQNEASGSQSEATGRTTEEISTREQSQQTVPASNQPDIMRGHNRQSIEESDSSEEEEAVFPPVPENNQRSGERRGRLSNILMRSIAAGFTRDYRENEEEQGTGGLSSAARSALLRSVRRRAVRRRRHSSDSAASSEIPSINTSPRPAVLAENNEPSDEMDSAMVSSTSVAGQSPGTQQNTTMSDSNAVDKNDISPSSFKLDAASSSRNEETLSYAQRIPDGQFRTATPPSSALERLTRQLLACKALLADELPPGFP